MPVASTTRETGKTENKFSGIFPNEMIANKSYGCPCVVKLEEDTQLSALQLVALMKEAGIPQGSYQKLSRLQEDLHQQLHSQSSKYKYLSFNIV